MAKIEEKEEEKSKEFKQALRSSEESFEELKQALDKLLKDPEKYADDAMILAAERTVSKFKEIIRSRSKDRSEKIKEMAEISNAFKELYSACEPYLSDGAKKKISEILEAEL
jgi:hypothetical protein